MIYPESWTSPAIPPPYFNAEGKDASLVLGKGVTGNRAELEDDTPLRLEVFMCICRRVRLMCRI